MDVIIKKNIADVKPVKYYLLRAFPKNLKQLSLILTIKDVRSDM